MSRIKADDQFKAISRAKSIKMIAFNHLGSKQGDMPSPYINDNGWLSLWPKGRKSLAMLKTKN